MRQKNGRYYVRWTEYHPGPGGQLTARRVEKAAGTDRRAAEAEELRLKTYWEAVRLGRTPHVSFDAVLLEYLKTKINAPSFRSLKSNAKHLAASFSGRAIADLTPAHIRQYAALRKAQGAGASVINHEIQLLSGAIKHANDIHNWQLNNPCPGTRQAPPPSRVRWLNEQEQERLIAAAGNLSHAPLLQPWIIIALATGMRYREITELEWSRIDHQTRLIHLYPQHNKTRIQRSIPMNDDAIAAIATIRQFHAAHGITADRLFVTTQGRPIKTLGKRAWKTACAAAGITDLSPSDLRHVAASNIVRAGGRLEDVKQLLGHTSIRTTEIYAHLSPTPSWDAVRLLQRGEKKGNDP